MNNLKFAIQKSGRLTENSIQLLRQCGYEIEDPYRKMVLPCSNHPMDIYFLRDNDIPKYILDGIAHFGIVGENLLHESFSDELLNGKIKVLAKLPFGKCRLSLAFPKDVKITELMQIAGKTIATSYPNILASVLDQKNIEVRIVNLEGGVEIAPLINMSDGIFDIVSTGSTLKAHGLVESFELAQSQCVLVARNNLSPEEEKFAQSLVNRIECTVKAKKSRYLMLNAPKIRVTEICKILPGADSPSIIELSTDSTKVAIHAVTNEEVMWETIEKLKAIGASSILVLPIEKIME